MMDIKESMSNISEWVKKHPLAALAIVGGVILLAYLVSKSAGSGGGGLTLDSQEPGDDEGGGLGFGGGGNSGGLDDLNLSASPVPVDAEPVLSRVPSALPSFSVNQLEEIPSFSGAFDSGMAEPVYSGAGGVFESTGLTQTQSPAKVETPASVSSVAATGKNPVSKIIANVKAGKLGDTTRAPRIAQLTPTSSGVKGGKLGDTTRAPRTSTTTFKLPSLNYTGYYQGVFYLNGKPMSSNLSNIFPVTSPVKKTPASPVTIGGKAGRKGR